MIQSASTIAWKSCKKCQSYSGEHDVTFQWFTVSTVLQSVYRQQLFVQWNRHAWLNTSSSSSSAAAAAAAAAASLQWWQQTLITSQLILPRFYQHQHHLVPPHRPRDRCYIPACHVTSCRRVSGRLITCLTTMSGTPTTHQQVWGLRILTVIRSAVSRKSVISATDVSAFAAKSFTRSDLRTCNSNDVKDQNGPRATSEMWYY